MIKRIDEKTYYLFNARTFPYRDDRGGIDAELYGAGYMTSPKDKMDLESARKGTMAWQILDAHNQSGDDKKLKLRFDALTSHDITYVGIIQSARASGLKEFPMPYVLTNCHNSLCAVGGTINEYDHRFGLSAAKKYGGVYVPAHLAVIHQYMRERMAGCGKMILGSDSHTRYGALGALSIGEGGPELAKQLCNRTYDIDAPEVIAVHLNGRPRPGVGPQDVALAIIREVFKDGFVKNKILEFIGPGIRNLSMDYRNGIDVMTTETTCLSSIWQTDETTRKYLAMHGREDEYRELKPARVALYDGMLMVDLSRIESMIALPFHPSNAYTIREFSENAADLLHAVEEEARAQFPKVKLDLVSKLENGRMRVDQGIIAGCAGGSYENLMYLARTLQGKSVGAGGFDISAYPASQPIFMELLKNGAAADICAAGVTMKTAFCGPCFGAGDTPANNGFSIRHTTRNFPNREGSKPSNGQLSLVALMDARSIAATAANGGILTAATEMPVPEAVNTYHYDSNPYDSRVFDAWGKADRDAALVLGPNITDWPEQHALTENLLLQVASVITDPVTTTDELIPSGETSSYRSNPHKLAEFALSRRDPEYVGRAKRIRSYDEARVNGNDTEEVKAAMAKLGVSDAIASTGIGSVVCAVKPGDGSAREQAASCQRVLGGCANIAREYATKRYRSNLINWGMLPFTCEEDIGSFSNDAWIYIPGIRAAMEKGETSVKAAVLDGDSQREITLTLPVLTEEERTIILRGCLINHYRAEM